MRNNDIDSVDYSSTRGWEALYQEQFFEPLALQGSCTNMDTSSSSAIVEEWHSSISLETIADLILMTVAVATNENHGSRPDTGSVIVMIGCGTSHLPSVLLDRCRSTQQQEGDAIHQVILVDASPTCLQLLRQRYESVPSYRRKLAFVCADVTQPSWYASASYTLGNDHSPTVILDKGLLDALFCGDGWERPVQAVLQECRDILSAKGGGCYILISYKLPKSTQEFLASISSSLQKSNDGDHNNNDQPPLFQWEFDVPKYSTDRVSVSFGRTLL